MKVLLQSTNVKKIFGNVIFDKVKATLMASHFRAEGTLLTFDFFLLPLLKPVHHHPCHDLGIKVRRLLRHHLSFA